MLGYLWTLLDSETKHGYFRFNHGYWDTLTKARNAGLWPLDAKTRMRAEPLSAWEGFFSSGFAEKMNETLRTFDSQASSIDIFVSLGAFAKSRPVSSAQHTSMATLREIWSGPLNLELATLPKHLVETGKIVDLFSKLSDSHVLLIGPGQLSGHHFKIGRTFRFLDIPEWSGYLVYESIVDRIHQVLKLFEIDVIVFQASAIGLMSHQKLRSRFPSVKWLDLGLALSVLNPNAIAHLPWFRHTRSQVMDSYCELLAEGVITPLRDLQQENLGHAYSVMDRYYYPSLAPTVSYEDLVRAYEQLEKHARAFTSMRLDLLERMSLVSSTRTQNWISETLSNEMSRINLLDFGDLLRISRIAIRAESDTFAVSALDKAIEKSPSDPRPYALRAELKLAHHDPDGALGCLPSNLGQRGHEFRSFSKVKNRALRQAPRIDMN